MNENMEKLSLIANSKQEKLSESQEVNIRFIEIKNDLENIRSSIKGEQLSNISAERYEEIKKEFKKTYKKFDIAKKAEIFEDLNSNNSNKNDFFTYISKYNTITSEIQTLISRIDSKFQTYEFNKINKQYTNLSKLANNQKKTFDNITKKYSLLEEIAKNMKDLKDNFLTVSSIIFTAFTLIQLNFVAFQNSNDYTVLDRLILFSGINLFLIVGILGIMSIIKKLSNSNKEENLFTYELKFCFKALLIIFICTLGYKYFTKEVLVEEERIIKLENQLIGLNKFEETLISNNKKLKDENEKLKNEIIRIEDQIWELKKLMFELRNKEDVHKK